MELGWLKIEEKDNELVLVGCSKEAEGEIVIPDGITIIGGYAFKSCLKLSGITIPDSVTSIGEEAFYQCDGISSIVLPAKLKGIGRSAFRLCGNLTTVNIPNSVTRIGEGAFAFCHSLNLLDVAFDNPVFDSRNKCSAIIESDTNIMIAGCKNTIIPDTITAIGNFAFGGCHDLLSIIIPNGVKYIGKMAFSNCGFNEITIPESVAQIDDFAFMGCRNLESVIIPDDVILGKSVFNGCNKL